MADTGIVNMLKTAMMKSKLSWQLSVSALFTLACAIHVQTILSQVMENQVSLF